MILCPPQLVENNFIVLPLHVLHFPYLCTPTHQCGAWGPDGQRRLTCQAAPLCFQGGKLLHAARSVASRHPLQSCQGI